MSDKNKPFLMLMRSKEAEELMKKPDAFMLLTQISMRAKRNDDFCVSNLKTGEAFIGDFKNIGLTERRYRTAKSDIQKFGLASFKATNRGTIAKLTDSRVYNINEDESDEPSDRQATSQATGKRQAGDEQATTNKKLNNIKKTKKNKEIEELELSQFETFWIAYAYKKSKPTALKSFSKALEVTSLEVILAAVTKYTKTRGKVSKYWKHPATWLNQGCWDDDDYKSNNNSNHNLEDKNYDNGTEGFIVD